MPRGDAAAARPAPSRTSRDEHDPPVAGPDVATTEGMHGRLAGMP